MFEIYIDNTFGVNNPILTINTDYKYEEVYLKYYKEIIPRSYRLYKYNDVYFLTDENNIIEGIKTKINWTITKLFGFADKTMQNYLKGL